jgi:beta-xylosidase
MSRRHLQLLLSGSESERIEALRRQWDPLMAHRTPAHVTLASPEEFDDEALLLARTREATRHAFAFAVAKRGVDLDELANLSRAATDRSAMNTNLPLAVTSNLYPLVVHVDQLPQNER